MCVCVCVCVLQTKHIMLLISTFFLFIVVFNNGVQRNP